MVLPKMLTNLERYLLKVYLTPEQIEQFEDGLIGAGEVEQDELRLEMLALLQRIDEGYELPEEE